MATARKTTPRKASDVSASREKQKNKFAERFTALRVSRHLTQQEMASKIGIHQSKIAIYESGTQAPSVQTLARICAAFSYSADFLIGITDYNVGNFDSVLSDLSRLLAGLNEGERQQILTFARFVSTESKGKVLTDKASERQSIISG